MVFFRGNGILAALTLRAVLRRRRVQDTCATTLGGTEISPSV